MSVKTGSISVRCPMENREGIERGRKMNFKLVSYISMFIAGICSSFPAQIRAGSVNGVSGVTSVSCEDRRTHVDMSWCTDAAATQLYEKCLVMIHKDVENVSKCDWQGCGPISLVGEKAKIDGDNVVEYGIKTPFAGASNPPANWNLNPATKEVLPKFPYNRQYMTIPEFVAKQGECKRGTNGDPVLERICPIDSKAYDMNVYFYCMKNKGKLPSL